jgi:hypothetical protein
MLCLLHVEKESAKVYDARSIRFGKFNTPRINEVVRHRVCFPPVKKRIARSANKKRRKLLAHGACYSKVSIQVRPRDTRSRIELCKPVRLFAGVWQESHKASSFDR